MGRRLALILALASMVVLSTAALAELKVENLKCRAAKLGPPRTDVRFSLGETIYLTCDLTGLQKDAAGRQNVEVYFTVKHDTGKTVMTRERFLALHEKPLYETGTLAAYFALSPGAEWPMGNYTLTIEVQDRAAEAKVEVRFTFALSPVKFGIINPMLTVDEAGKGEIPWCVQKAMSAYIHCMLSGPSYGENNRLNVSVDLTVSNEQNQVIGRQRVLNFDQALDKQHVLVPINVGLCFNVSGNLRYEMVFTDNTTGQTASVVMPIKVME